MKESSYKSYDDLPLSLNAETSLLFCGRSGTKKVENAVCGNRRKTESTQH